MTYTIFTVLSGYTVDETVMRSVSPLTWVVFLSHKTRRSFLSHWFFPSYSLFTKLGCPHFSSHVPHCFTGLGLSHALCNYFRISLRASWQLPPRIDSTVKARVQNSVMAYTSPAHRCRDWHGAWGTRIFTWNDPNTRTLEKNDESELLTIGRHRRLTKKRRTRNFQTTDLTIQVIHYWQDASFDLQIFKQNLSLADKNQWEGQRS